MKKILWDDFKKEDLQEKIFLLPTDTVYGFHTLVFKNERGVKKLKELKERESEKFIILISSLNDLEKFNIQLSENQKNFLKKIWPGKVSVIFKNNNDEKFAFRLPEKEKLRKIISEIGPIYSTSANKHGEQTVSTPNELNNDLKSKINFYIDEGVLNSSASTLIEILR